IGGGITAAVVFVLPGYGHAVLHGNSWWTAVRGFRGLLEALGLLLMYALIGGVFALIPSHESRGQSILVGLGVQTTIKSILAGGKEVLAGTRVGALPADQQG
ncbi:MAG TPA: hypothetical protein VFH56_17060, partial [Acidimicrobiales bacterium]|nr:hypothetical protein [Acidimicrobiales bacterium]